MGPDVREFKLGSKTNFITSRGMFVQTLWRDWLTDEVLAELNLNERHRKAVLYLK